MVKFSNSIKATNVIIKKMSRPQTPKLSNFSFDFELFQKSIQKCPQSEYTFKSTDVCKSGKNCFYKKIIPLQFDPFEESSFSKYALIKTECICEGKLSYKCNDFCALNKRSCEYFKMNTNYTELIFSNVSECISIKNIADCGNDFILFERKPKFSYINHF